MIEEVNSIVENEFNKAEKGSTEAFNPIEIFDELGLIYGDGKTEEEIQKSVNEKYEAKINEIKKNNQIKINGDVIEMTEKGYEAGGQRIIDKYNFPTQEEYENKFNEIQKNLNDGKISYEQAQAQWKEYQNNLATNENNLKAELEDYDKQYTEQANVINKKIEEFQGEQEKNWKIAEERIKAYEPEVKHQEFI